MDEQTNEQMQQQINVPTGQRENVMPSPTLSGDQGIKTVRRTYLKQLLQLSDVAISKVEETVAWMMTMKASLRATLELVAFLPETHCRRQWHQ